MQILVRGASINYVDKEGEGGGPKMSTTLHKLIYLVNLSTNGEGVKKDQKSVNVIYGYPLI